MVVVVTILSLRFSLITHANFLPVPISDIESDEDLIWCSEEKEEDTDTLSLSYNANKALYLRDFTSRLLVILSVSLLLLLSVSCDLVVAASSFVCGSRSKSESEFVAESTSAAHNKFRF